MLVLGIESSCDETAAAVVADGRRILSNVVASQVLTHEKYGGVVPELASREHLRKIVPVVEEACARAGVGLADVDGVAVTEGPGLIGSLLVGLVYGKAVALALGKPLVGVNHLEGHIHAVLLDNGLVQPAWPADPEPTRPVESAAASSETRVSNGARIFPNVTLVASGGHTILFRVEARDPGPETGLEAAHLPRFSYRRIGQTRDDAAGEAFDKVAKLLALGYPGGPVIDKLAPYGNPQAVAFGKIRMKGNPFDFSFSGLKTAVLYRVRGTELESEADQRRAWRKSAGRVGIAELRQQCSPATLDLAASFQRAVVGDLVERTLAAADDAGVETILVSGGVACNSLLRQVFAAAGRQSGLQIFFPSLALSTDNAAMIAAAGYFKLMAGQRADPSLTAHASFPLGQ